MNCDEKLRKLGTDKQVKFMQQAIVAEEEALKIMNIVKDFRINGLRVEGDMVIIDVIEERCKEMIKRLKEV